MLLPLFPIPRKYLNILPALPLHNCILLTFLRDLNVEDVASDSLVIKRQNMIFCSLIFQENILTDKLHTHSVSYVKCTRLINLELYLLLKICSLVDILTHCLVHATHTTVILHFIFLLIFALHILIIVY